MADGILDGGELLGTQRGADGALNLHRYRSIGFGLCENFLYYSEFLLPIPSAVKFFFSFLAGPDARESRPGKNAGSKGD
jgi:hypothetical protein